MRRPAFSMIIFYILGIMLQYNLTMTYGMIFFILLITITMAVQIPNKKKSWTAVLLLIIFFLGSLNFKIHHEYDGKLQQFYGKNLYVVGNVIDADDGERLQLTIEVEEIIDARKKYEINDRIIGYFDGPYNENKMMIGKKIGVYGIIMEPQKRRNPKMFDYKLYLKGKKIYSLLYSTTDNIKEISKGNVSILLIGGTKVKKQVVDIIGNVLPSREGNLLLGILLGEKKQLDKEIYEIFKGVGVAHILAVSGLHVGILYIFLEKSLRFFPLRIRIILILATLYFYVIITGYAPSVLRASSMAAILILAPIINRRYDSLSSLSTVALVYLIINPMILFQAGFQLSFAAVMSIILFYGPIFNKIKGLPMFLAQIMALSVAAQIGTIPVTAYHFNNISIWAIFINIPIVIMVGYLVPMGLLIIIIGFFSIHWASILGWIPFLMIKIMILLVELMDAIPFSSVMVISPSYLFIIIYYLLCIAIFMDKNLFIIEYLNRKIMVFSILGLYFIFTAGNYFIPNKLKVTFVDVGQGDCILIQTPMGKNILLDGGGNDQNPNRKIDVGEDILLPFLLKNGIGKIHILMLSHVHKDHMGGFFNVLDHLKVNALIMGTDYYKTEDWLVMEKVCLDKEINIYKVRKGDVIDVEKKLNVEILHPSGALINNSRDDINNNSLVVLMKYGKKRILFTGDIEAYGENVIMKSFEDLRADVLKVAHHGSRYSSVQDFVELIKPEIAVIQVGKNFFGHPHKEVLNRLENENIRIFRNDENGAVILTVDDDKIQVKTIVK